jgi:Skp family chaperone for outer membrane proteins
VNRVDANAIHNVYNNRVSENVNRVSYNGGNGGINARATSEEEAAARGRHTGPVAAQTQHAWAARNNPQQRFSANHGAPPVTATPRANLASHPKELPPIQRSAPNTGNAKLDQKYQKQQGKLIAQQNHDRQKLQQQQDKEHQQLAKQKANQEKTQQVEQRHQQQTQQLQQRHTQQTQQMQQRQQPAGGGESRSGGRR